MNQIHEAEKHYKQTDSEEVINKKKEEEQPNRIFF